jgi:NADPH2:quinone reductase
MKAVIITQPGPPDVLHFADRPEPVPGPTEVLIKVAAAGVNRPDVAQRKGQYPPPPGASVDIPGLEVSGTVVEVGSEVKRWKHGDHVCALLTGGGYAQYCVAPEGQCLPVPNNMLLLEAASLPETFYTVWSNVFDLGRFKPGDQVLVHGGSSGIGVAAIQMVKAMGGTVYVTAGSEEKCTFCEHLGATKAFNYNTTNFKTAILEATGNRGVDLILDMVGGDYTADNIALLATEGRLVLINTMRGRNTEIDLLPIMHKRLTITGSTLRPRDVAFKSEIAHNLEKHIWPLLNSGKIKPVIHEVFQAAHAAKAHQLMEESNHMGKIMLSFEGL